MMGESNQQEVIVRKKRPSRATHGHHGGSWKIAFADFMTAMMALFLLLWLVNVTSEEQRKGIADFFNPMAFQSSAAGGEGVLAGTGDVSTSAPVSAAHDAGSSEVSRKIEEVEVPVVEVADSEKEEKVDESKSGGGGSGDGQQNSQFEDIVEEIKDRMSASIDLKNLAENVIIEVVDEGLRIQITDREGAPMFPVGSTGMTPAASAMVQAVASTVSDVPNLLAITGHTDSIPYRGNAGFDNWDLSSGRANSARRILMSSGIGIERISRVEGLADTDHLVPEAPEDPRNRRISILVLRR